MIRRLAKSDYEVASRLLARINASAKSAFLQAIESGSIDLAFINDSIDELGVVISARQANKSMIYVSFETDPVSHQIVTWITDFVEDVIAVNMNREIYLHINADNRSTMEHLREMGFREVMACSEYKIRHIPDPTPYFSENALRYLEFRPFKPSHISGYIELLDAAFRPIILASGREPNGYRRHRDQVMESFIESSRQDRIGGFWFGNELIGIYQMMVGKQSGVELISLLAVHPEHQRRGVGSAILNHCLDKYANLTNNHEIYVYVLKNNEGAHRFYLRHGFVLTSRYSENRYDKGASNQNDDH